MHAQGARANFMPHEPLEPRFLLLINRYLVSLNCLIFEDLKTVSPLVKVHNGYNTPLGLMLEEFRRISCILSELTRTVI